MNTWTMTLALSIALLGCASASTQKTSDAASEPAGEAGDTAAGGSTGLWSFEGVPEALEAMHRADWSTAWGYLHTAAADPAAAYLLAICEANLDNPRATYRNLKRARDHGPAQLLAEIAGGAEQLERWSLPAVLGTSVFCTRNPKDMATAPCPDEEMDAVRQYCREYFGDELECAIRLGEADAECSQHVWFFDHMDNPNVPDNMARCSARQIFADWEFPPAPEVFIPQSE